MKKGIMPTTDQDRMKQLDRAAQKAPSYATLLNLSPAMLAERTADAAAFRYTMAIIISIATGGKDWTAFKKLIFGGPDSGAVIPFPVAIDFATPVPAIKAGISKRFSNFAAYCKLQPGCTENVAIDLGIVSTGKAAVNLDLVQPVIKLIKRPDGIFIDWTWNGLADEVDTIELHVDRSDGQGDRLMIVDSTPGYLDATAFPGALTKWTYKGIWRIGETQVGLWSNPVSIVVGG